MTFAAVIAFLTGVILAQRFRVLVLVPVLALTMDGANVRTIDPTTRNFFFGVGGIILVGADQPEGIYTATFDVTASYL